MDARKCKLLEFYSLSIFIIGFLWCLISIAFSPIDYEAFMSVRWMIPASIFVMIFGFGLLVIGDSYEETVLKRVTPKTAQGLKGFFKSPFNRLLYTNAFVIAFFIIISILEEGSAKAKVFVMGNKAATILLIFFLVFMLIFGLKRHKNFLFEALAVVLVWLGSLTSAILSLSLIAYVVVF